MCCHALFIEGLEEHYSLNKLIIIKFSLKIDIESFLIEEELALKDEYLYSTNEWFNNIVQGNYFAREYSIVRDLLGGPLYLN